MHPADRQKFSDATELGLISRPTIRSVLLQRKMRSHRDVVLNAAG